MTENKDYDELKEMMSQPKKSIGDTHVRSTFLLDAELLKRLDRLAEGKRGFKSKFFNAAVKRMLDELEGK